jgi:uncharacterized membrane protein YoaK (UPF0700 family)
MSAALDDVEQNSPGIAPRKAAAPVVASRHSKLMRSPSSLAFNASPVVHVSTAILAFLAGFINAIGFVVAAKTIGNVTGLTTKIATDLASGSVAHGSFEYLLVAQFISFAMGSVLSGVLISSRKLGMGTELYGIVLMLVSLLIFSSWSQAKTSTDAMVCLLASAMGLQNGMLTKHA